MCFVRISEHTASFAVHVINWLDFITVVESVYSAVRTDSLYETDYVNFCLHLPWLRRLTVVSSRRRRGFDPRPFHFMMVRVVLGQYFSPSCFFPCRYQSISASWSSSLLLLASEWQQSEALKPSKKVNIFQVFVNTGYVYTSPFLVVFTRLHVRLGKFSCFLPSCVANFCVESVKRSVVFERTCLILLNCLPLWRSAVLGPPTCTCFGYFFPHIRNVYLDIINVLFIHQLMH